MEKIELVIISMEIAEHKKLFDNISFRHRIDHLPGKKTVFILLFFFPFTNPIHVENRKTCLGNRISLRRKEEEEGEEEKKKGLHFDYKKKNAMAYEYNRDKSRIFVEFPLPHQSRCLCLFLYRCENIKLTTSAISTSFNNVFTFTEETLREWEKKKKKFGGVRLLRLKRGNLMRVWTCENGEINCVYATERWFWNELSVNLSWNVSRVELWKRWDRYIVVSP